MPHILSTENEWRKWQVEDERLNNCQLLMLLEHLDPNVWAVAASRTGITLTPRDQIHGMTTWERTLLKSNLKVPADWTGCLSRLHQVRRKAWKKSSSTSSKSPDYSLQERSLERVEAAAFSLSRLLTAMQDSYFDGRPMTGASMLEKSR